MVIGRARQNSDEQDIDIETLEDDEIMMESDEDGEELTVVRPQPMGSGLGEESTTRLSREYVTLQHL